MLFRHVRRKSLQQVRKETPNPQMMVGTISKTLCRVSGGKEDYYLLNTIHEDSDGDVESFNLALTNGIDAWCGSVSGEYMDRTARKLKMQNTEYVDQCRKALSRKNVGSLNFLYEVKSKDSDINFVWKKHLASDNIKFQLGSLTLSESDNPREVIRYIFDSTIESSCILEEQITSLTSDKERLANERATALKRLEKCVAAKEEMEADLYGKFVTVLNDKKVKLRELKAELEDALASESGPGETSPEPGTSKSKRAKPIQSDDDTSDVDMNDDKTDSEYNTDEETQMRPKKGGVVTGSPDKDSSLLLDDGLQEDDQPVTTKKRRRGGLGSSKKQTPSKPVLPKVTSSVEKLKSGRSSARGSLRKSSSTASKSSDNIETDDLIDNL